MSKLTRFGPSSPLSAFGITLPHLLCKRLHSNQVLAQIRPDVDLQRPAKAKVKMILELLYIHAQAPLRDV